MSNKKSALTAADRRRLRQNVILHDNTPEGRLGNKGQTANYTAVYANGAPTKRARPGIKPDVYKPRARLIKARDINDYYRSLEAAAKPPAFQVEPDTKTEEIQEAARKFEAATELAARRKQEHYAALRVRNEWLQARHREASQVTLLQVAPRRRT